MADKTDNDSILDFTSVQSRRAIRPALRTETFGLAYTSNAAILILHDLRLILKTLHMVTLKDREKLFNVTIHNGLITEKILMIYINAPIDVQNKRIAEHIILISKTYKLTDVMTKSGM